MATTAVTLVDEAKSHVETLRVEELAAELDRGDTVLVDLREPEELAATGRIPGSVHVPRGMLEFRADPTSPYHNEALHPSKRVVLHCASGARSRARGQGAAGAGVRASRRGSRRNARSSVPSAEIEDRRGAP